MSTRRTTRRRSQADQEEIDRIVISQAADDSAWEPALHVRRPKTASFSVPGELAARAAFLARIHHESRVEKWVEKVLRERIELEESAFKTAKRQLAS
ncbi:MAG TPA: hypothetical protein VIY49_05800 [Bryobacteraceae bacterium]